ncbi:MAG: thiamine pyrophosphate-binding protein [Lachnospiraceae bacterium]|nr:thiamine pyrophosphate-binding protein [Lachnospiraceae bacterium]
MKKKIANYIADFLVEQGIRHNFTVTGGGAMHLNDALGHKEGLTSIFNHHEQACAIAAEAYSRLTGNLACLCVTSGPGGTNALTGVLGSWLDSIPMLILSGQVKREMTIWSCPDLNLRQLGDQEFNIADTVQHMTKYAVMVTDPYMVSYHLEKALYLCKKGKGGPVWLDIPLDIQGARVDVDKMVHFVPEQEYGERKPEFTSGDAARLMEKIKAAKAPLLLAGSSIRYSKSEETFLQLVEKLNIPVVTAWAANDTLSGDHPCFMGVPGTLGTRAANFAVQQCDLLLTLGCRMNVRMVGYNKGDFASNAYKVMVDICEAELHKPTYEPDWAICADVKDVLEGLVSCDYDRPKEHDRWLRWCQDVREKYPVVPASYHHADGAINPYVFTEKMFEHLDAEDTIVSSNGSSCVMPIQVSGIKQGQRYFCNSGCAAMGYGLPAALGAAVALGGKRVICLEGDGSIMMNLQELPTVRYYGLNMKIFIYNNKGYHSIRQTQRNNFGEPLVGVNNESGVAIPDFEKVAAAFDIPYFAIHTESEADGILQQVLETEGAVICEAFVDPEQNFAPKSSSKVLPDGKIISPSIDEMAPFLPQEEYRAVKESWQK